MNKAHPENKKKTRIMRSKQAMIFFEEVMKGFGFIQFISGMASFIDSTSFKARSALHQIKNMRSEANNELNKTKPTYEPIKVSELKKFEHYISELVFVRAVDQANYYISDALQEVFKLNISMLKNNSQLPLEKILSFKTLSSLYENVAETYVNSLMYKSTKDMFVSLKEKHGIDPLNDPADLAFLSNCNLKRNILIHNSGKINQTFLDKFTGSHTFNTGDRLKLSFDDVTRDIVEILKIVVSIDKHLYQKFNLPIFLAKQNKISKYWYPNLPTNKRNRKN